MSVDNCSLTKHFQIQSEADLDFVIGQRLGYPIGMQRKSPPEFRRRIAAAAASYQLQLRSIDYALKRYIDPNLYEDEDISLGDEISDYLYECATFLEEELENLHTIDDPTFGIFGAEITLYKAPHALDAARMLSNRGLLLEVLPILRLCLEMMSWAHVAFRIHDEDKVISLKSQNCISTLKNIYKTSGKIYGYLSRFTHWGYVVHRQFLTADKRRIAVFKASVRYRAMSLALYLVILDILVEVIREMYAEKSEPLILRIQGVLHHDETRNTYRYLSDAADMSGLSELKEIQLLLQ